MRDGKLGKYFRAIKMIFYVTMRQNFSDAFIIFAVIVQPMIIAILAFWMLRERGGDIAIFVIVGSGLTGLWSGLLFISGNSITGERWEGTLKGLVASPTPMSVIVLGKNRANVDIATFPPWMQTISYGLPLTRGIQAACQIVQGASFSDVSGLLTWN